MSREHWLNGHFRTGSSVLIGTGVHCTGCGKFRGITSVAFEEDYEPPEKRPDWPFNEDACPVCAVYQSRTKDLTVEDLSWLPQSTLRQALIEAKKRSK